MELVRGTGILFVEAALPLGEHSLHWKQVPKCARVLHNPSSVLDTGVDIYKYERLQYSPLRTPHCTLWRPESGQAETWVGREGALGKVLHMRHSQPGEFSESWGA